MAFNQEWHKCRTIILVKINQNKLIRQCDVHNYDTRNKGGNAIKIHNKEKIKQCPTFTGVKFANFLLSGIKEEENCSKFKNELKDFLIDLLCYCLEDFYKNNTTILLCIFFL
jgi:hypothetical protein